MPDITLTGGGSGSVSGADGTGGIVGGETGAPQQQGTTDTLGQSQIHASKKVIVPYNPQLAQALFLLWFNGGSTENFTLQKIAGGPIGVTGMASAYSSSNPADIGLFILQTRNEMHAICIKVLDGWTEQIKKEIEERKAEMKKDGYKEWEARQGHAGYEAWLATLSPEQRLQVMEYPHFDKQLRIDEGILKFSDYMAAAKSNDPSINLDLPFFASAVVVSGALSSQYATMPDTVSTTALLIAPIKDAQDRLISQYSPTHASELGYIGALFSTGTAFFALGQTVNKAGNTDKEINYEFAKNYAQKILSVVNGSEFNSLAMALLTGAIEEGGSLSEERIQELVKSLKIVLLSTALALLYKTESSFKEVGGGITGKEFIELANGNEKLLDSPLKQQLAKEIANYRGSLPTSEGDRLIASIGDYVDKAKSSKDLIDVANLLSNITHNPAIAPEGAI